MEAIRTDDAPASIGPYSKGIVDGDRVFVSGQGPVDPVSGDVVNRGVPDQTAQTLVNIGAILDAGGSSLDDIGKSTVFETDLDDYEAVNEVYGRYLSDPHPARRAVEVADLPIDIALEIEVIARR